MTETPHWEDEVHGAIKELISFVGSQMPYLTTRAAHPRQMAAAYLARMRRLVLGINVLYDAALPDVLGGVLRIAYETWATGMWVLCIGDEAAKLIDADYVIQTNQLIERLDMDIDIIPEIEGAPKLPQLWKRIDALEAHLVEEGVSKVGDLDITHKIVYGPESGMGVHAGFASVIGHLDVDERDRWIGVHPERIEADDGADKLLWAASLLTVFARRLFEAFGVGVTNLDEVAAPIQRAATFLAAEYESNPT
jgi:hypothetical protein